MKTDFLKHQVLDACRYALRPIVRVLLRNGVTWKEFAEIGKELFVDVARSDYGIQRRPTNTARVALMTGLSRREVTRMRYALTAELRRSEATPNRISRILTAWHVDSEFVGADGKPAVLPLTGDRPSVSSLLKRYAGDMPHGAVLKELEQLGLVEAGASGYRVTSRQYIRSPADPDLMRQAGVALHDHATTVAHNVDASRTEPARFERMATTTALPRRHVGAFRAFLEAEGRAFLEKVDAWLAARALEEPKSTTARPTAERSVRTGVGVFLIHADPEAKVRHEKNR